MTRRRIGRAVWLPCHQEPATSMVPAFAPARRGRYRLPPALLLAAHSRSRAVILEDPVPGPGHHSGSQRRDLARLVNGFARLLASLGGVTSRPRCVCAVPPEVGPVDSFHRRDVCSMGSRPLMISGGKTGKLPPTHRPWAFRRLATPSVELTRQGLSPSSWFSSSAAWFPRTTARSWPVFAPCGAEGSPRQTG